MLLIFFFVKMDHIFKVLVISISFKYVLVVQKNCQIPKDPKGKNGYIEQLNHPQLVFFALIPFKLFQVDQVECSSSC